ncbi:unnamed protein product [Rotaria socialis]|uniref:Peptidase M14 domain-containing protein n=1 Tax=Rotaria socialis TaxID=392032 RepID=A0A820XUS9_9BILA|nr:unnamed protein product [Rotaria socialis]CAF3308375.1 unnamed protein product [Rotaria socialis]CAF3440626.1 unnamed protein product [Rotaria socialis]CAF3581953.1 unnamed protein product [Rotaria socialis]CAF3739265.1 unnamed protein product [Rotaria socialis]
MSRLSYFVFILISIVVWSEAEREYIGDKLVSLEPLNNEHIKYLQDLEINGSLDFWTEIITATKPIDVRIKKSEFDQYASEFKQRSLPFRVIVDDVQAAIDDEKQQIDQENLKRQLKSRFLGQPKADIVGTYASYDEMVAYLADKAQADSQHITVVDIGQTYENRRIQGISIKFNPAATRNIWIDCGIHAREWITPAACIWMVDKLIDEYNKNDATVTSLLNYWNVYIAPSLNPDGYQYSRTTSRLWRKSRARGTTGSCYGVDLNRNYPRRWMTGGASSSECSDTYAGRSAGSEPETKGVINFLQSKIGTWDMYMSFHSYGQWWFTPYGYDTSLPANYNSQYAKAQIGANAIKSVNSGRTYAIGSVAQLLYIASGSTIDWAYDDLKIPFANTVELPPISASPGFVLPPSEAPGVCHETYVGMKAFLAAIKQELQSSMSG